MLQADQRVARSYMVEVQDENGEWWTQYGTDSKHLAIYHARLYADLYTIEQVRIRAIY